jgi:hypothetical protein
MMERSVQGCSVTLDLLKAVAQNSMKTKNSLARAEPLTLAENCGSAYCAIRFNQTGGGGRSLRLAPDPLRRNVVP